jgi:hypothetical protein
MPPGAGDPALHHRRILAGPKPHLVVIGLQNDRREITQEIPHRCGGAPEIVCHAHTGAGTGPHRHREWFGGIMAGGAGLDGEGTDLYSGAESQRPVFGVAKSGGKVAPGAGRSEHRDVEEPGESGCPTAMITVLMGQNDARHAGEIQLYAGCAAFDLPGAEPGIDQQRNTLGLDRAAVSP